MSKTNDLRVAILDRPNGAESLLLTELEQRVRVQKILPDEIHALDPQTEVMLIRGGFWSDMELLLKLAPGLRWIHVNMAGLEHLDLKFLGDRGVILTNSQGVLDRPIAEFVIGAVLLWSKGLYQSVLHTHQGRWSPREPLSNGSMSTLILGAGGIGAECAKLLKQVGFGKVAGFRRDPSLLSPIFDEYLSAEQLPDRIGDFDVVICSLPSAESTENLVSARLLKRLGRAVVFINVGRGDTVDQKALAEALSDRPESLAILDVTEPEPLPSGHPLLQCRNVVISPHIAGETVERHDNFTRVFIENLDRFLEGAPLKDRAPKI